MIKDKGSIFIDKKPNKINNGRQPYLSCKLSSSCLTYELINQSLVSTAAKSVGDKYRFTQELFNVLQQIDEFFTFILFIFLLSC